jgi:hypothetical protein
MKKRKTKKKKKPKKKPKSRRGRVKQHKGPFQIELPLQMPLFPPTLDAPKQATA